jgi:sodium-coupled neutral amino acid transporter 10
MAYVAHYNAPTFYRELKNTNSRRFAIMVSASYSLLTVLYIVAMVAGFSTFGSACHGNILLNYHSSDMLATLGRLATGCSILFGFPLIVTGTREGLINCGSSLGYPQLGKKKNHVVLVGTILTVVTVTSCAIPDVSLVVGLTGATLGSAIVYICPALIYTRAVRLVQGAESPDYRAARWNLALVPFGVAIATLGVYMTIQESLVSSMAAVERHVR